MTIERTYTDVPHWPYLFSYYHAGTKWGLTVLCMSWADAEARAELLNLTLEGPQAFIGEDVAVPEQFLWKSETNLPIGETDSPILETNAANCETKAAHSET